MANTVYKKLSVDDWNKIPVATKQQKPSQWDGAIQDIISGEIIAIPVESEKELKGARIGMSRRASSEFNIKLAFRYDEANKILAARLSEKPDKEKASETAGPKRRGRPPTVK